MTVAELIEVLKHLPQDAKVFAIDADYYRVRVEVPEAGVFLDGDVVMIDPVEYVKQKA
jgi:predicted thioredoxin/glutaredoxin